MEVLRIQRLDRFNPASFYSENAYHEIRIPGIVSLNGGELLCYYECRRGGDWSPIDVGLQKSVDGGRTWSPTRIIANGKGRNACNNPVMIPCGDTLYFFYCENYKRLYVCESKDGAETFSPPQELTDVIDTLSTGRFWSVLAAGPGHGAALDDGTLFLPMWFGRNETDMFAHHPSCIAVLKRDPGGKWSLSSPIGEGLLRDPSECCIAVLPEGRLLLNIRNENPLRRRAVSFGDPKDNMWETPRFVASLPDPVCAAGLCRCGEELLFTNCRDMKRRRRLSVTRLSAAGQTIEVTEISLNGGYSDVCYSDIYGKAFAAFENGSGHLSIAEIKI
jgi:sialidase-1